MFNLLTRFRKVNDWSLLIKSLNLKITKSYFEKILVSNKEDLSMNSIVLGFNMILLNIRDS